MNLLKKLISLGIILILLSQVNIGYISFAQDGNGSVADEIEIEDTPEEDGATSLEEVGDAGMEAEPEPDDSQPDTTYDTGGGQDSLESFNVTDFLTVPGEQGQSYLADTEVSPILAFILTIINFLSKVIGTVAILLIIIGGLLLLASEGDDNKVQKGKGIIVQAIIGLIIALASYMIVTFVQSLLYVQS